MSYQSDSPIVQQHCCELLGPGREPKVSMYQGKDVFISMNASESSLSPFSIPEEFEAKEATVSAVALCTHWELQWWSMVGSTCISRTMTGESNQQESVPLCLKCRIPIAATSGKTDSDKHSAYNTRHSVSNSHIFLWKGCTCMRVKSNTREKGVLLRVYNFTAFSVPGLLISGTGKRNKSGKVATGTYFKHSGTTNSHLSNH